MKEYLERSGRGSSSRPAPVQAAAQVRSMDKASAAFRAIDKDNSGFVDREEFLQFTRYLYVMSKLENLLREPEKKKVWNFPH